VRHMGPGQSEIGFGPWTVLLQVLQDHANRGDGCGMSAKSQTFQGPKLIRQQDAVSIVTDLSVRLSSMKGCKLCSS
jgi:hypothetical protein